MPKRPKSIPQGSPSSADIKDKIKQLERRCVELDIALTEQTNNTKHYLDLARVILLALDTQGKITMIEGKGCELLGYKQSELIGQSWFDLCIPNDQYDEVFFTFQQVIRGDAEFTEYIENSILTSSGDLRCIAWHNSLTKDDTGKITGTLSSGIDITDRVQAVQAREKSDVHFRNIIDASPVPYALNDDLQNITYLNPAFISTFGYDLSDIPTLADWWPKAYPDAEYRSWVARIWAKHLQSAAKDNKPFVPLELKIQCKNKSYRYVLASATLVSETINGNHLVILYDITEIKLAQLAQQDSDNRYRIIVETAQEGIWTIDNNEHTTFVNPKMADILGYSQQEMSGKSLYDFMDDEGHAIAAKNIERRKSGITEQHSFKFKHKNGNDIWTELQTSPLLDNYGNYAGALAMVSDITDRYLSDKALRESEKKYRQLFENMTTGFALHEVIFDDHGKPCDYRYLEINPAFEKLTGVPASALLGKTVLEILPETEQYWIDVYSRVAITGEPVAYQNYSRELDKTYDTWAFSPEKNQFAVIFTDISERKKSEDEVAALAERLALATHAAQIGIWDWAITNNTLTWDDRMFELYDINKNDFSGAYEAWIASVHPADMDYINQSLQDSFSGTTPYDVEFRIIWPDGTVRYIKADGHVVYDDTGKAVRMTGTNYDITDRVHSQEELRFLAHHDALTALPNRTYFMDHLSRALKRATRNNKSVAVFFMDLDRFKNINDTYGHETGDKLLQLIAECLSKEVRGSDTIARLGGDEFAVILEDIQNDDDIIMTAEKILSLLSRPFVIENIEFYGTTSIGISLFPDDATTSQSLLKNADTAMYQAKAQGRNTYQFYSKELSTKARERMILENNLRRALEHNEFVLYYQPQIELETQRLVAIEALVRWQHPELGLVPPAHFIPVAEETGLIVALGKWVIETACYQIRSWQKQGLPVVPVSVNLSGRQFINGSIAKTISQALAKFDLAPSLLEIEITEGVMMLNPESSAHTLAELSEMGIRIAIDDFGTGYSSLSYLKTYPIDTLKIDQSFVRDITSDPNDLSIVVAIIAMAHSMRLRVIAEGVETEKQLGILSSYKCDCVQGYLFSHPLPADLMHNYIANTRLAE